MQKTIKTEQIEIARAMAGDFIRKEDCYSYQGELSSVEYCNLIGLDYDTVHMLGPVSYSISYLRTIENKYQLACMTYIEGVMNGKLSVSLEGDTDFMGLYPKMDGKQSYYEKRKAEVRFSEEADRKLTAEVKKELAAVLKEDPRPAYQEDPEREYVFAFAGKQIHFRVEKGILTVSEVE